LILKRDNLTDSISREIRRLILEGEVAPGDWLPPQPELAARFGVGLSTVREGIKGLTLLGILSPQPGRGTQVSPEALHLLRLYDVSRARLEGLDLAHLLEARKTVEIALTGFAAERADEQDLARIQAALARMRETIAEGDAFAEADLEFHLAVAQAGRNPLLESFYHVTRGMLAEAIRESVRIGPVKDDKQTILRQQERILADIAARNPQAARRHAQATFVYWDEFIRISARNGTQ
jgi:GntR family transcriptional repressor for pyruvate dehydrogenase complex